MKRLCVCLTLLAVALSVGRADEVKCPKECRCLTNGDKDVVDCSRRNLTLIPLMAEMPAEVYTFDMSMNQIKRIDVLETNTNLKFLDLASNVIDQIEPNAFEHLTALKGIDLSHNQLKTLPAELLGMSLMTLNLSHNNIEILPEGFFDKTVNLKELRLAHNNLRMLDPDDFKKLGELKVLDLSAIGAFSLKEDMFHHMFELTDLDLSENDFMMVPTVAIRSARNLRVLRLNQNLIRILDEHSFMSMSSLTELYLNNNRELGEVKAKTFSYLWNLQKLSMVNNPHLSYIDENAFYGTFNRSWIAIKEVDLRANRLSTLTGNTLPFCNLTSLDLRENAWTCDCHLQWAKHCHLRPELSHGIICLKPETLRNQELVLIDHSKLVCDHNPVLREVRMMRLFLIIFVSFTLFFFGVLLVMYIKRDSLMRWWSDRRRGNGAIYYVKAHTNPIEPDMM